jgi:hypothetical protein
MSGETWLMMDYEAGECELSQVGSPKKVADAPDDDMTPSERLKRDALVAYKSLGGPEYLKRNPDLLDKALLKMIAEPPQKVDAQLTIKIDAPWMSPDRLSYNRQEVIDVEPVPSIGEVERADRETKAIDDARARHAASGERLPPPVRATDLLPEPDPRTVANPSARGATPKRTG